VGGGALLRNLDRGAEPFGLATTAGNVSHTGVGGLTLGGGMGWLARQFGLACDNVESYTLVTADAQILRVTSAQHPELFWALRGGGGNFGVVTEFQFRLHPVTGRVLLVDFAFDPADAVAPLRLWRDLLPSAPREATLTADVTTVDGRPVTSVGFVWAGDSDAGRSYLRRFREVGEPQAERVEEMAYVELQSIADEFHHHGRRRYSKGHYLRSFPDAAIDAFLSRGVAGGGPAADWSRLPNGGFQAYGGAIADIDDGASAFSQRQTLIEWGGATSWTDPAEDDDRMAAARAYGAAVEPFASGVYVNMLAEDGEAGVRRAYGEAKLNRLAEIKRQYDPDNVFRLNQNILPAPASSSSTG
jgi:FAD/FMN-containing dehydrogenase